jgi:hypothetical protein
LELKPTKIGESFYLLIPKPLKELFEIRDDTRFTMLFEADGRSYKLIYLSNGKEAEEEMNSTKALLKKQG